MTEELLCYEISRKLASEHLTTIRRVSVLLSRMAAREKLTPEDVAVVWQARRSLRAVGELIEGGLG